jgi:hypothetical protein
MKVPVGPFVYDVQLVDGITLNNRQCYGLTQPTAQVIKIDRNLRPDRRISVLWHELLEAWKAELDVHQTDEMDTEAIANLVGLAMAAMSPRMVAKLHAYMTTGIEADDVLITPAFQQPIPILRFSARGSDGPLA